MPYKSKEEQREYQRLWMARRRADFFLGKECVRCKSKVKLELDHIDPTQKVDHKVWSWAKAKREAELAKCQVLCEDCHKKKSNKDGSVRRGEQINKSRLKEVDIPKIRDLLMSGVKQVDVANTYSVTKQAVSDIALGKTWAWV